MIIIRFLLLFVCLPIAFSSQSSPGKKKKSDVKSVTVWKTVYENGKPSTIKESYEEYNQKGNTTMHIEYADDGSVQKKETAKYDKFQNKIEETEYDAASKKNVKKSSKFNANKEKTDEVELDANGKIIKKTSFTYNADGEKEMEISTDASGKILKKTVFSYNSKGLKSERKTYSGKDTPETFKKWEYQYY